MDGWMIRYYGVALLPFDRSRKNGKSMENCIVVESFFLRPQGMMEGGREMHGVGEERRGAVDQWGPDVMMRKSRTGKSLMICLFRLGVVDQGCGMRWHLSNFNYNVRVSGKWEGRPRHVVAGIYPG